ncbi:Hydantoinase/oxoprolinase-domain-containing protein [Aspergillus foveolatus]|uniref:Hydantoinase/oxoprolinase-domain-containing protein n=1 Tax=Aspergillus foveolatus TaxID=210207 RepID=UPI003CCCF75F
MTKQGGYRLGADVGGTFTDVYAFTPDNQVARAKVPTTVVDQSIGIKNRIRKVQQDLKDRFTWDGKFQFIHHGTTVATNGGRGSSLRPATRISWQCAGRRSLVAWYNARKRMSVDGKSVVGVDVDVLRDDLKKWTGDEKPEAVAISLLNSHCNNEHEVLAAGIVKEVLGDGVTIISSSDVLREVGEFERTLMTCTNALVKPVVQTYLSNLQDLLAEDGNTIRILKSDGGLTSLELAGELPINILMSGPAGGVQGVADVVTQNTPYKNLITFDIGGTSTDVAIIHQGKPQLRRETVVGSLTVRSPAVDIRTVGAGGGSIAKYMSITETMRVGRKRATVSDANLVLGYLPEALLGGEFKLDTESAMAAVGEIAEQMKLSITQAAEDIVNLVIETMYGALRLVSVEQGYDPKETLCALGYATTRLSHSQSLSFIRLLSATTSKQVKERFDELEAICKDTMTTSNGGSVMPLNISYHLDLRCHGQALNLTQFKYCLTNFELELMRLEVVSVDASPGIEVPQLAKAESTEPSANALVAKKQIVVKGEAMEAALWDREKISSQGVRVDGSCIITEMDSNTLILPGCYGEIDSIENILIRPSEEAPKDQTKDETPEAALEIVQSTPLILTLVASALASIRSEMDTLMLRCSMSPAIRGQQDEFNVITTAEGKMLVGQFGSFITQLLRAWKGTIEEGDGFITNDTYMIEGAVTHLNDVIVLLPIFYEHRLIDWASQFGHLTDVGGIVPGSMSINASSIFDDGVQIPCIKLYTKGVMNTDLVDLLCRNSRQSDWYRSDLMAITAACRTASSRVCELVVRFGCEIYLAACKELLLRNRTAMIEGNRLLFDWSGTSPQSDHNINFYLSETMFRMFIGYYMITSAAPGTVINDGFHDLIDIHIPEGSILKPVRPASISCRTHMMGRTMDVMQALIGMRNPVYAAAAGFSDSPHFFYSGHKPDGEWYQLYQIGFGGVPARNAGDGLDCHCLFPAIKSIPTEIIELNYPLRIEANESVADSGGAGFYRGGNAQRTNYRFLARGEFSIHDDRWFTKPWGIRGGKPGARSRKILYRYSKSQDAPSIEVLPSKCDHIRVDPGDLLEWITWGGGGLGDPLTRPAEKVALEVRRHLVTIQGARDNYGVVVHPESLVVDEEETEALRKNMMAARGEVDQGYDRGGTLKQLRESCLKETGLPPPAPQWEQELYGPHVALPYVQDWYSRMKEAKGWEL